MGLSRSAFTVLNIIPYVALTCRLQCAAFGFAAALVESIPIVGLLFTISNRIGAAMWAHGKLCHAVPTPSCQWAKFQSDLEKRQHAFAAGELTPLPPSSNDLSTPSESSITMVGSL